MRYYYKSDVINVASDAQSVDVIGEGEIEDWSVHEPSYVD